MEAKVISKKTGAEVTRSKTLVPKLRFKGFTNKWLEKSLEEIFKINAGGDIDETHVSPIQTEKHKYPIYANAEKNKGFYAYSDIYKVEAGTITIAGRGVNIGIAHARDHKFYPIVRLLVLIPLNNENINFGEYAINRINLFPESTGVPQLTVPQVSGYKISIPTLPEQQKIATFLSAVDEKIQQLTHKKELLEHYKKGVMQQLFSGKLRFKDKNGKAFPKWEKKKLGEIGQFQTSSVDKLSVPNEQEVYLVNYMNVYKHEKINKETIKNLQIVTAKDNQIISSNLKKGDILFTPSSETPSDIGHSVVIFEDLENCVYSYHLMRFRPIIDIDILYSHYFCNITSVLNQLSKLATGSTRFTISVKSFSSIIVNLPCIDEQKKIANYLSNIDYKIESVTKQISQTQTYKKGLLQQMFV